LDTARYVVALFLVCALPPLLLFWPVVHGFIGFWRRVGPCWTYGILLTGAGVGALALYGARENLLEVEFGTRWPLIALSVLFLSAAAWFRVLLQRELSIATLAGLPELAPDRRAGGLITSGLYSKVRHPRYSQFSLGVIGWSLFANYLALYLVLASWLAGVWLIVVLEEHELRERFGPAYDEYSQTVPRFLPRLRHGGVAGA
jgi:protein-S-isoprenylcysteine O-methyltransferase Ste14